MTQINKELAHQRKLEKRQALKLKNKQEKERKIQAITHSKYALLKGKEQLNDKEKKKLNELSKIFPELIAVYQAKEKLRDIFNSEITSDCAFWQLVEWTESCYQYFPNSCQTIKCLNKINYTFYFSFTPFPFTFSLTQPGN